MLDGLNEFGEPFEVANAFRILATSADSIHLTCFSRETDIFDQRRFWDMRSFEIIYRFIGMGH